MKEHQLLDHQTTARQNKNKSYYCSHCDEEVKEEFLYCPYCGKRIVEFKKYGQPDI